MSRKARASATPARSGMRQTPQCASPARPGAESSSSRSPSGTRESSSSRSSFGRSSSGAPESSVNLRQLVLAMLLSVTKDGAYSHIVLREVLDKYRYLSKQERSFITRLFLGTLEQRIWLDYVIDWFSKVRTDQMKPVILNLLRIGVYELQFFDQVPARATISEAVRLTQKKGFSSLKGFVNGVLRTISREQAAVCLPRREEDETAYLSVRYSMPAWIVAMWRSRYDAETVEAMLAAFLQEAPTCIRVNTARSSREELTERLLAEQAAVRPHPQLEEALYLSGYDSLEALFAFQEGLFYVQDASSMQAVGRAGIRPGDFVLDVCAAPGGKSLHAAQLLFADGQSGGQVEARDLTERKTALIAENARRCGFDRLRICQADARILRPQDVACADVVLADLPCSGLGVIGKKADIKYRITPEQITELAALQREILHTVQQYVKPGGVLLYSTCTISASENEENVAWFLQEHPDFCLDWQEQLLPAAGEQDGFFIARLVKKSHSASERTLT